MKKSISFAILGGVVGYGLACYHGVKVVGWVLGGIEKALKEDREESSKRSYGYGYRPISCASYSNYKDRTDKETKQNDHRKKYSDLVIPTREEAERVLNTLNLVISISGRATVADLYSFVGIPYTNEDRLNGWEDLRGAKIIECRHGFILDLPWAVYKSQD